MATCGRLRFCQFFVAHTMHHNYILLLCCWVVCFQYSGHYLCVVFYLHADYDYNMLHWIRTSTEWLKSTPCCYEIHSVVQTCPLSTSVAMVKNVSNINLSTKWYISDYCICYMSKILVQNWSFQGRPIGYFKFAPNNTYCHYYENLSTSMQHFVENVCSLIAPDQPDQGEPYLSNQPIVTKIFLAFVV